MLTGTNRSSVEKSAAMYRISFNNYVAAESDAHRSDVVRSPAFGKLEGSFTPARTGGFTATCMSDSRVIKLAI